MDVWYVAYGSNMRAERLGRYLAACRDTAAPRESRAVVTAGTVYFATESRVWGGGRAFCDPGAPGAVWGRAYLLSAGQFSDIAAQEMYREAGADLDLGGVLARGRAEFGPGRYETLVRVGELDGVPLLTFTAPWSLGEVELRAPVAAYLRQIAAGLREAGAWSDAEIARYLATRPGVAGCWGEAELRGLIAGDFPETY
ncbi:histone deacetylase [Streptomyces sp. NPDC048717]|uniref:histone deacetylase n=1 Tax=unclassified Streptomyces TaxID=2593676 RepID=UPI00343C6E05